jgi:hypothetical protein
MINKMKKNNGKTIKHFFIKVMLGLLLIGLTTNCNPSDKENSDRKTWMMLGALWSTMSKPQATTQGTAQVSMSIANSQLNVTRVDVTITGGGIVNPVVRRLTKVGQNWQGVISGIPTGTGRIFLGQAYDTAGTLLYQGQAVGVTITFNQTTDIFILLQDLFPAAPFVNTAPVIDAFVASTNLVPVLGPVNFSVTAHDANPTDTLTYIWTATGGSFDNSSTASAIWSAPTTVGSYTISIKVTDNKGSSCIRSYNLEVRTDTGSGAMTVNFNAWPVVESIIATDCCIASETSTSLTMVASDVDGDLLSYHWTSSCGIFDNASAQNPLFTATTTTAGECTVTVNIADGRGGVNSGSLTILIKAPIAPVCADISTLADGATITDVCSSVAFTSGANTIINGNVTTLASYTSGLNALVTGNVTSGSAYTSGANSIVNGNVSAVGDVTLGADSKIIGSVHSGTGVIIYGANATVGSVLP